MADVARSDVAWIFLKIGAIGFGGPAIIGLMQHEVQGAMKLIAAGAVIGVVAR